MSGKSLSETFSARFSKPFIRCLAISLRKSIFGEIIFQSSKFFDFEQIVFSASAEILGQVVGTAIYVTGEQLQRIFILRKEIRNIYRKMGKNVPEVGQKFSLGLAKLLSTHPEENYEVFFF